MPLVLDNIYQCELPCGMLRTFKSMAQQKQFEKLHEKKCMICKSAPTCVYESTIHVKNDTHAINKCKKQEREKCEDIRGFFKV